MYTELNGKRLLILGGSLWKDGIKKICTEHGITIVSAGNDSSSGICDIADEYYNVNSTNVDAMKKLIMEKHIDGVYMGGNEPVIAVACQYIKEMGLPCYCTIEQWNALQDKRHFKDLCKQFDLPVVKRYELKEVTVQDFPVITKPADGSGSNGFSVCNNPNELEKGIEVAKKASPTENVIIEQFVPNDGIVVFYTISNGKLKFSTMEDKYPVRFEQYGTYVGGLFDFESPLSSEFRKLFENKIQMLVDHLLIKEGNFWIEVFYNKGKYFFNEVGFRYGGSGSPYPVDYFSGINQIASDIYYALTGKSKSDGFNHLFDSNIIRKKKYAIYPIFLKSGIISSIQGVEDIKNNPIILNILSMKKKGNTIIGNGSFGQVALLIHFVYDSFDELKEALDFIHSKLVIKDSFGNDMILRLLDINKIILR